MGSHKLVFLWFVWSSFDFYYLLASACDSACGIYLDKKPVMLKKVMSNVIPALDLYSKFVVFVHDDVQTFAFIKLVLFSIFHLSV